MQLFYASAEHLQNSLAKRITLVLSILMNEQQKIEKFVPFNID